MEYTSNDNESENEFHNIICDVCKEHDEEEATDLWFYKCDKCHKTLCEDCKKPEMVYDFSSRRSYSHCEDCFSPEEKDSSSSDNSSIFSHQEEIVIRCSLCDADFESVGGFKCCKCDINFCNDCKTEIEEENICSKHDCYYCSWGTCFNNYTLNSYCEDCVPDKVIQEIEEREMEEKQKIIQEEQRRKKLIKALNKAGLKLRSDSKFCKKYILGDFDDIDKVVERMCQMKYLYDYQDMKIELSITSDDRTRCYEEMLSGDGNVDFYYDIPDVSVFQETEDRILDKIKKYPEIYPWQKEKLKNKAARIIQRNCENWLWKPVCKDGSNGIHAKMLMKHVSVNE